MISRFSNLLNAFIPSFKQLLIRSNTIVQIDSPVNPFTSRIGCIAYFHCTNQNLGLMEFFDVKDNWAASEVRVGRAWKKEELRIKSNQDLHKLWFVLLKEQNMLLTMEQEYNNNVQVLPSAERIYKVKESMVHLEDVIRERNKAYYMLETGETGERPGRVVHNRLGMKYFYKSAEHVLPQQMNRRWFASKQFWYNRKEVEKFHLYYREKLFLEKRKERIRERNIVLQLLKRFPDMDLEAAQQQYPNVDVNALKSWKKARGHWVS